MRSESIALLGLLAALVVLAAVLIAVQRLRHRNRSLWDTLNALCLERLECFREPQTGRQIDYLLLSPARIYLIRWWPTTRVIDAAAQADRWLVREGWRRRQVENPIRGLRQCLQFIDYSTEIVVPLRVRVVVPELDDGQSVPGMVSLGQLAGELERDVGRAPSVELRAAWQNLKRLHQNTARPPGPAVRRSLITELGLILLALTAVFLGLRFL